MGKRLETWASSRGFWLVGFRGARCRPPALRRCRWQHDYITKSEEWRAGAGARAGYGQTFPNWNAPFTSRWLRSGRGGSAPNTIRPSTCRKAILCRASPS